MVFYLNAKIAVKVVLQSYYLCINSVKTNGPTLCPIIWLPYAPNLLENPRVVGNIFTYSYSDYFDHKPF